MFLQGRKSTGLKRCSIPGNGGSKIKELPLIVVLLIYYSGEQLYGQFSECKAHDAQWTGKGTAYMKQKLMENREKLTDAAYRKAFAAAESIESLFSVSGILNIIPIDDARFALLSGTEDALTDDEKRVGMETAFLPVSFEDDY